MRCHLRPFFLNKDFSIEDVNASKSHLITFLDIVAIGWKFSCFQQYCNLLFCISRNCSINVHNPLVKCILKWYWFVCIKLHTTIFVQSTFILNTYQIIQIIWISLTKTISTESRKTHKFLFKRESSFSTSYSSSI